MFQDVILFFQVCVMIYSSFKLMLNRSFLASAFLPCPEGTFQ